MSILRNIAVCTFLAVGSTQSIGATAAATATEYPKIPFVAGLSIVKAVTTPEGDYEVLGVIESLDASGYRVVASTELPGDNGSRCGV